MIRFDTQRREEDKILEEKRREEDRIFEDKRREEKRRGETDGQERTGVELRQSMEVK